MTYPVPVREERKRRGEREEEEERKGEEEENWERLSPWMINAKNIFTNEVSFFL